jgi:hypothetical protein
VLDCTRSSPEARRSKEKIIPQENVFEQQGGFGSNAAVYIAASDHEGARAALSSELHAENIGEAAS